MDPTTFEHKKTAKKRELLIEPEILVKRICLNFDPFFLSKALS